MNESRHFGRHRAVAVLVAGDVVTSGAVVGRDDRVDEVEALEDENDDDEDDGGGDPDRKRTGKTDELNKVSLTRSISLSDFAIRCDLDQNNPPVIGLHHWPDGITNPKYKLLCFMTTNFFANRRMH